MQIVNNCFTEHEHKRCTFLNRPCKSVVGNDSADSISPIHKRAPHILSKLMKFVIRGWGENNWSGCSMQQGGVDDDDGNSGISKAPLSHVQNGLDGLSMRFVFCIVSDWLAFTTQRFRPLKTEFSFLLAFSFSAVQSIGTIK